MKKLYRSVSLLILVLVAVSSGEAYGAMNVSVTPTASFDVKTTAVNKIEKTNITRFAFQPIEIKNNQNIAYWGVRLTCANGLDLRVNELDENVCNKAVRIERTPGDNLALLFTNSTGKPAPFSFKFKAYDKNGNWLHSEKRSFQWK